ncbi:sulfotransferase family 2 domain-containing protein [Pontibaca salina]|uniref:Sulfotransferase family 2 domain-containing protein n=1 Tax=Pontibaca salina TaxID=2795731 RepID=A0A934HTJ5_9RHOB|nr:sulfotransferase family 2 domain-containing protein [Pontibaca salina]MBI6630485.1 sulfotransferase family 2 domain-containing protein [Pontibaca salina]
MLVFFKEKLVFLAVPKTGTTAFQTALADRADIIIRDPPELKHAPLYRYNRFFRPMFERVCNAEMETLALMREPISWLGSWYRYRRRPFTIGKTNSTHDISFDDFVQAYLAPTQPGFANIGSQAKFLEPQHNGTAVTHLFRYEQPDQLRTFLEDRLGVSLRLERENVSPQLDLTLSPAIEDRYRRKYDADFALYDSI